jgi:hypothetical protein
MKWETPDNLDARDGRSGAKVYADEAQMLKDKPGEWGIIREWRRPDKKAKAYARIMVAGIKRGRYSAFRPEGYYDSVSRTDDTGVLKVYAMYQGEPVDPDAES